ncbi:four helix bundle protein [Pustulibacterium marinum]|uniref:Four helix bundle protein n=1 Tax=Pustulibacterium marinum TaxID=1224947 RepID=A0A1I7F1I6_9FLAO|nr:four helix bundle protein [Pustulibacterium marinum]SFU30093.1 four helix bundle protein [Pustulibacterium marinum]
MDHKDLEVWKRSMRFVAKVYKTVSMFPAAELYGLSSQLKRSVLSIPSNIAEGAARQSDKELIRFLYIALGSAAEVETQLLVAVRVNYLEAISIHDLLQELEIIKKLILGLINYLKNKP